MPTACILFDLDDTLIYTEYKYSQATIRALDFLQSAVIPQRIDPRKFLERQYARQCELVYTEGLHNCYAVAWRETAAAVLDELDITGLHQRILLDGLVARLRDSLNEAYMLVDGAIDLLDYAKVRADVVLVTAGDETLQREKLRRAGLTAYFTAVRVTPVEKGAIMREYAAQYGVDRTLMVGNSLKSDILPAIELGLTALCLPTQSWDYNQVAVDPTRYIPCHNLWAVKGYLSDWLADRSA